MTSENTRTTRATMLHRLADARSPARADACRELRLWNDEETVRALIGALGDADPAVRESAWLTLLEIGDASTARLLVPLLRSEDALARNNARSVLDRITSAAPDLILDLSRDPDPRLRVHAAGIMGGTGDHEFVARLMEMLGDSEVNVRDAAIAALGTLRALEAVTPLAAVLREGHPWLQLSSMQSLAKIGGPDATRGLVSALAGADADLREALEQALERLRAVDAVEPLAAAIESGPDIRATALRLLLGPFASETLRRAELDSMRGVATAVAAEIAQGTAAGWDVVCGVQLLVATRFDGAEPAVARLLEMGTAVERVSAARAAGLLGLRGLVPALQRAAEGADAELSREIRESLRRLGPPPAGEPANRPRVLLVDDSDVVRGSLQWMLRPLALDVIEAGDGREALRMLEGQSIDLAIVDLNMPQMDGVTLVRALRAQEGTRRVPIVVLTTEDRDQDRRDAMLAGANIYLVKPPSAEQVRGTVWSLLGRSAPPVAGPRAPGRNA